jgi:hypothetical protein
VVIILGFLLNPVANVALACLLLRRRASCSQELGENISAGQHLGSATRTALTCACLFTVCQTPAIAFMVLSLAEQAPFCSFPLAASERFFFGQFVWLFTSVYYSINFYMYCAISKKFRKQLQTRFPLMSDKFQGWIARARVLISPNNSSIAVIPNGSCQLGTGLVMEEEMVRLKDLKRTHLVGDQALK